jgi:hypothetical protein
LSQYYSRQKPSLLGFVLFGKGPSDHDGRFNPVGAPSGAKKKHRGPVDRLDIPYKGTQ